MGRPEINKYVLNKADTALSETANLTPEQVVATTVRKPQSIDDLEINFARIDAPDDIKNAMQALTNESSLIDPIQAARRGVRSNEATLKSAEDIDGFNILMNRRQGQTLNAEEITAARNFYYKTTDKLLELAKKAASPEASDIDQYAFRKMIAIHHATQKDLLGARAEVGRALQAWSIPSTNTPAEKLKGMETILNEFGGAEASKDLAKKLASYADGSLTLPQINQIVTKSALARSADALTAAWTAGLLTNPVTHAKNLISNTYTTLTLATERYSQALLPNSKITVNEANSFLFGIIQAQKEAFANAGRAFRTGQSSFDLGKIELPRVRATSKEVLDLQGFATPFAYAMDYYGRVVETSFRALAAGDEYSKTVLYKAQLTALATREAISNGLNGEELKSFVANSTNAPSEEMVNIAKEFANYGTYTKELGSSGKQIQKIIAQNPALRFVIPFFKTPTNIFKFTFERTPLALLSGKVRQDLASDGVKRSAALAKIGLGSSLMALGVDGAINGNITGNGPVDKKTREALLRIGWQPHSIKIGDKYYRYEGIEPLSSYLSMSANMAEIMTNYEMYDLGQQEQTDQLASAMVLSISDATINKTFLTGLSSLIEAMSMPTIAGEGYVRQMFTSIVPTGVGALERAISPEKEYVFNLSDSFKSKIPGFSSEVAKRRNVYGEVIKYRYPDETIQDQTSSGIVSLFNPFYVSQNQENKPEGKLDKFLLKNGYFVSMPAKQQEFDGVDIDLSDYPEIYSRFLELRGQEISLIQYDNVNMKRALENLVSGEIPQSIIFLSEFVDGEEKQKMIDQIVSDYSTEAKNRLKEEYPVINQLILENSDDHTN